MIFYELSDLYQEHILSDDFKKMLDSFDYIKFYAFILHNRTINCKPHYHCMIQVELNNKKAKAKIEKDFKKLNPFVKCIRNQKGFARYLQHLDYVDKEKYEDNEVVTNNRDMFEDLKKVEIKKGRVEDLLLEFYNYLVNTGDCLSTSECFLWFSKRGQANYYICHQKSINDFMSNLFSTDEYLKDIERRLNIKDDLVNISDSYTINSLLEIES